MQLVRYSTAGGTSVLVETAGAGGGYEKAGDGVTEAEELFEQGVGDITAAAESALAAVRSHAKGPDEVQLEFGVNLTAGRGAVIAQTAAAANLRITLRWAAQAIT